MIPFKRKKISQVVESDVDKRRKLSASLDDSILKKHLNFSCVNGKSYTSTCLFMYQCVTNKKLGDLFLDTSETLPLKNYVPKFSFGNLGSGILLEPPMHRELSIWPTYEVLRNHNAQVDFYKKMMQLV